MPAGVGYLREYRRSCDRFNAGGDPGPASCWLTPHTEYLQLGRSEADRQSAYRQLFRSAIPRADLQTIRDGTHKGWALGDETFSARIEALSGRRVMFLREAIYP